MTLNSFRRLLKSLDFKAEIIKYQNSRYKLWRSPTNRYVVVERPGLRPDYGGFSLYSQGRGRGCRPFNFYWDSSSQHLQGYDDLSIMDEYDSALDPEPVILRRLTVLGIRPNINGIYL